ncbi:FHA domain-containing protein [Occultella glacieicola]|uniref:FHA domain-containing protein n=1 Tax=Occultella glacieicola TaxID=2518684 RepID=A0ABY2DZ64_9MICO|nr:FHA domain-containing protein [Occultella glacieicola]TDE89970.1 FHA domain-containing protein [Occultella glacieicola]
MGHAGEAVPARRTRAALLNGGPTLHPAPAHQRARFSLTAGAAEYLAAPADRSLWPDTWTLQRIRRDALGALVRVYCGWPRTIAAAAAVLLGAGGGFLLIQGHDAMDVTGLISRIAGLVLVVAAVALGGYVLFTGARLVAAMSAWGRIRPQDRVVTTGTLFTPAFVVRVVGAVAALAGATVLIVRQLDPETALPAFGAVAIIATGIIAGLGLLGSVLAVLLGQRAPSGPGTTSPRGAAAGSQYEPGASQYAPGAGQYAPGASQYGPGGYASAGAGASADPPQWQPGPDQPVGPSDPADQQWAQPPQPGMPDQPGGYQGAAEPWAQPPQPGVPDGPDGYQSAAEPWMQPPQPGMADQPGGYQGAAEPWAQPGQPGPSDAEPWAQPPPAHPMTTGHDPATAGPAPSAAVAPAEPALDGDDDIEHTRLVHRNLPPPAKEDVTRAVRAPEIQVLLSDGRHLPLNATTLLGRAPQARTSEQVEGLLEVDDPAVSKTHLSVRIEGNKVWVTDRASTNGTILKGPGGDETELEPWLETAVAIGATVHFGHVVLSVLLDEATG